MALDTKWRYHGKDLRKGARYGSVEKNGRVTVLPITLGNKIFGSFAFAGSTLSEGVLQSLGNTIAVGLAQAQTQQAANRADAVRRSEELKSVMIDALAHELKTPLTAIEAAADMLHGSRVSPEQQERSHRRRAAGSAAFAAFDE